MGLVSSRREGRVSVYRLSGSLLREFEHVRAPVTTAWSGSFELVLYDVPESMRLQRDRLRTSAHEAGFAAWRPGVLVGFTSPQAWVEPFRSAVGNSGLVETGGWAVDHETARRVVNRAWGLTERRRELTAALERIGDETEPLREDQDGWGPVRRLHQAFRDGIPLLLATAPVPAELLPDDWPGSLLTGRMRDVSREVGGAVRTVVTDWLAAHPLRHLVEYYPDDPKAR